MNEYVGLDVSKEETSFCVMDGSGKILAQGKALSDPGALFEALRAEALCAERIVLETGTLSGWLARGLRASRHFGCKPDTLNRPLLRVIHWKAEAKGHHNKAPGQTAGSDFGDTVFPAKDEKRFGRA